jgi:preprotein translocase subunit SecF
MTVIAMLVFGGEVLRSFSWALFIGIIIGTYSSIYIASPFMLWWEAWRSNKRAVTVSAPVNTDAAASGAPKVGSAGVSSHMLAAAGVSTKPRKKGK